MKKITKNTLNFLPKELSKEISFSTDFYIISSLITLFVIYIIIGTNQALTKNRLNQELKSVTQTSGLKSVEIDKINKQLAAIEKKEASSIALKSISDKRQLWGEHFKEISLLVPNGVWITKLEFKKEKDSTGIVIEGESLTYQDVSLFYGRLSKSIHYSELLINSSEIDTSVVPPLTKFLFGTPGVR